MSGEHDGRNGTGKHSRAMQESAASHAFKRDSWWVRMKGEHDEDHIPPAPAVPRERRDPSRPDILLEPPGETGKKHLEWWKWILGVLAAVFIGGFTVAQYLSGLAKNEDVKAQIRASDDAAKTTSQLLDSRISTIEKKTFDIRIEQVRVGERQKLLDSRMELLIERSEGAARSRRREMELEAEIRRQVLRVDQVETSPTAGIPAE